MSLLCSVHTVQIILNLFLLPMCFIVRLLVKLMYWGTKVRFYKKGKYNWDILNGLPVRRN